MGSGGLELSEKRRSEFTTEFRKAVAMTASDDVYHPLVLKQI